MFIFSKTAILCCSYYGGDHYWVINGHWNLYIVDEETFTLGEGGKLIVINDWIVITHEMKQAGEFTSWYLPPDIDVIIPSSWEDDIPF
jgi:hypothetical protein